MIKSVHRSSCKVPVFLVRFQLHLEFVYRYSKNTQMSGNCGGTVVKVLCYKSEGRWFDPSWCNWNFSLT